MKADLKEGAFFMFRCALAGLIILVVAGIIYGVVLGLVAMTGIEPRDNYSFGYQYLQAGFWIGFFALVKDLKEYWRYQRKRVTLVKVENYFLWDFEKC